MSDKLTVEQLRRLPRPAQFGSKVWHMLKEAAELGISNPQMFELQIINSSLQDLLGKDMVKELTTLRQQLSEKEKANIALAVQVERMRQGFKVVHEFLHLAIPSNVPEGFWAKYDALEERSKRISTELLSEPPSEVGKVLEAVIRKLEIGIPPKGVNRNLILEEALAALNTLLPNTSAPEAQEGLDASAHTVIKPTQ